MNTGISSSSSAQHIAGLPPGVPSSVAEELSQHVAAEDRLTAEALERFGEKLPPRRYPPLQLDVPDGFETASTLPARRPVYLSVGTQLTVSPTERPWYVVGTHGESVRLAQKNVADGGLRTTSRTWASLVERNPQLLDAPFVDATGQRWIPFATTGVDHLGRSAPVEINSLDQLRHNYKNGLKSPTPVTTTWDDVLRATELTRRRPIAAPPRSMIDAAQLRHLIGDRQFVSSLAGDPYGLRGVVVGTGTAPGRAADVLADATSMQDWFHEKVGIDVWGPKHNAVLMTDSIDHLANASAGLVGDNAVVYEGPRSARVGAKWLSDVPGAERRSTRRFSKQIRRNDLAVRTHEAGHVATMRTWGPALDRFAGGKTTFGTQIEDGIVQEAVSDLLGAARSGKAIGARDLTVLQNGWANLDQLRSRIRVDSMTDVHSGTQLLTKPMMRVLTDLGADQLAEITGAAIRDIGHQVKTGSIQAIDLPTAARTLRDATAWRHGADSQIVKHLDNVWKTLGLLR